MMISLAGISSMLGIGRQSGATAHDRALVTPLGARRLAALLHARRDTFFLNLDAKYSRSRHASTEYLFLECATFSLNLNEAFAAETCARQNHLFITHLAPMRLTVSFGARRARYTSFWFGTAYVLRAWLSWVSPAT